MNSGACLAPGWRPSTARRSSAPTTTSGPRWAARSSGRRSPTCGSTASTTDVLAARAAGVRICLGADWSPSGSKNLLGELKVADLWNKPSSTAS